MVVREVTSSSLKRQSALAPIGLEEPTSFLDFGFQRFQAHRGSIENLLPSPQNQRQPLEELARSAREPAENAKPAPVLAGV
jgi:hypothetical protein